MTNVNNAKGINDMKTTRTILALAIALMSLALVIIGCGTAKSAVAGTMILSINPEIEIDYDSDGIVVGLEGNNDDGKAVIEGYSYEGKICHVVAGELVSKIYEMGYFANNIEEIRLDITQGSKLPSVQFVADIRNAIKSATEGYGFTKPVTTLNQGSGTESIITLDEAKAIAVAHANVTDPIFKDCELDDGIKYDIEFIAGDREYDYEIDAATGAVIEYSSEPVHTDPSQPAPEPAPENIITLDEAKAIAVAHANVTDPIFGECELELPENEYDIEFFADGREYDYEIDATTGAIKWYHSKPVYGNDDPAQPSPTPAPEGIITLDEAKAIAVAHANVTDPVFGHCELDIRENEYDIEFFANGREYDYEIHAVTGAILDYDSEPIDDDDHPVTPSPTPAPEGIITLDEAKAIAVAHANVTDPVFGDCEFDDDEGVYEIEFAANGIEYECEINALTGEIIRFESEVDD